MLNEKLVKEHGKEYLETLRKDVNRNVISVEVLESYYKGLIFCKAACLSVDYLPYIVALYDASVAPAKSAREEEKIIFYQEKIADLLAREIKKQLEKKGVDLIQYFTNMTLNIRKGVISFKQFCDYCDYLRIAIMAKIDNINYLDLVKLLQSADVQPAKTYDEAIKFNSYKKLIASYALQFEKPKNRTK